MTKSLPFWVLYRILVGIIFEEKKLSDAIYSSFLKSVDSKPHQ